MEDIGKTIKFLASGFRSSEFTALIFFVLLVLSNLYYGDSTIVQMVTNSQMDPAISEVVSAVRNQDANNKDSLQLILYAILGYFAKRGSLKWKELEVLGVNKKEIIASKKKIVHKKVEEE